MKAFYNFSFLAALLFINVLNLQAQVVITSSMMPAAGDTIRVSHVVGPEIPDPALTGFDYSWNYSMLQAGSQSVTSFVSPSQTPMIFQLVFNPLVANLASPVDGLDIFEGEVIDAWMFYRNTAAGFVSPGFAATVFGIPVPFKFDTPERLFKFPLNVNSLPDSTISELAVEYPSVGYVSIHKKRVNTVDGSGVLTTPYGTFNTIRLKSVIYEEDSIYIESSQSGFPIVRNYTEYKWLSPDHKIPLLTITREGTMTNVQYIDSIRDLSPLYVTIGEGITICQGESVTLTASVEGGEPPYFFLWNNLQTTQSIEVSPEENSTYSVLVTDNNNRLASALVDITVNPFLHASLGDDVIICASSNYTFSIDGEYDKIDWFINNNHVHTGADFLIDSAGIGLNEAILKMEYHLGDCFASDEITVGFEICSFTAGVDNESLIIFPNPVKDILKLSSMEGFNKTVVRIINAHGTQFTPQLSEITSGHIEIDVVNLEAGIYFIILEENNSRVTGKFIKQ